MDKWYMYFKNQLIGYLYEQNGKFTIEPVVIQGKSHAFLRLMGNTSDDFKDFVKGRVAPYDREGIGIILLQLGLHEYNAWEIFKKNGGQCDNDPFWMSQDPADTFDKVHWIAKATKGNEE